MDCFATLGLPRKANLEEETIRAAYHELSRKYHPDAAASAEEKAEFGERSAAINQARDTLLSPARRLKHLLELEGESVEATSSLSPELMDLFAKVGQAVQAAEQILKQKEAATSALGRALLMEKELRAQAGLQAALRDVTALSQTALAALPEVDAARDQDRKPAKALAARLSFLEKWQSQINEKLLALMSSQLA